MPIERRYQVFVSSTYQDLEDERREIIQALLELDCIPSGMEMFPAANDDQWTLIKRVIDDCDYYLVVIAGRYGSVTTDGMSFTEREYRYALQCGKPIIAFLHKAPQKIPLEKSEEDATKRPKLAEFRSLAEQKLVRYWETPSELGSVVSRSLIKLTRDYPADGWVRGGAVSSEEARGQILELQLKVQQLEAELSSAGGVDPKLVADLAKGEDTIELGLSLTAKLNDSYFDTTGYRYNVEVSWNEIFRVISPTLINEGTTSQIESRLGEYLQAKYVRDAVSDTLGKKNQSLQSVALTRDATDAIIVQFIALGYVQKGVRKRTVSDRATYFALTPLGERAMYELRAARRTPALPGLPAPVDEIKPTPKSDATTSQVEDHTS